MATGSPCPLFSYHRLENSTWTWLQLECRSLGYHCVLKDLRFGCLLDKDLCFNFFNRLISNFWYLITEEAYMVIIDHFQTFSHPALLLSEPSIQAFSRHSPLETNLTFGVKYHSYCTSYLFAVLPFHMHLFNVEGSSLYGDSFLLQCLRLALLLHWKDLWPLFKQIKHLENSMKIALPSSAFSYFLQSSTS